MSTIYAIGDIHGRLELLERLLEQIRPDLQQDRLIFMGDYIDRGPHPRGVVDRVLGLKGAAPAENVIRRIDEVSLPDPLRAKFLPVLIHGKFPDQGADIQPAVVQREPDQVRHGSESNRQYPGFLVVGLCLCGIPQSLVHMLLNV